MYYDDRNMVPMPIHNNASQFELLPQHDVTKLQSLSKSKIFKCFCISEVGSAELKQTTTALRLLFAYHTS